MANVFDNIITTDLKAQFNYAINEIIRAFSLPARFYLPVTKYTTCTSCTAPIYSTSPNPFVAGNKGKLTTACPVCGGTQQIPVESYEDLDIPVIFKYQNLKEIVPQIVWTQSGDAQTLSQIGTINLIKTCKYVIFDTNIQYIHAHKFIRDGEPIPMGFGSSDYISTTWKVS